MRAQRRCAEAVGDEDDEREGHEDRAQLQHAPDRARLAGRDELWQEGEEEDRELRIEKIDEHGRADDLGVRTWRDLTLDDERAAFPQHRPGHVEEVDDADVLQRLEGDRARVQEGREAGDRGDEVGDDPERAPEGGDDARSPTARHARRQRVDDPVRAWRR